jgi:sugar O-acyltransferase (sialic acid O-acetyltransferase NeuD family)
MRLVIFGTGENSAQAWYILRHDPSVEVVGFLDDDAAKHGGTHFGRPVLGGRPAAATLRETHGVTHVLVAIGQNAARRAITADMRAAGLAVASAVHPSAVIDPSARVGEGVIIEMGVCLHPECTVGDGVFLGGSSVVAHHSSVGAFALIGGGVVFGGRVSVGEGALVGVGVSIQPHARIGARSVVGVGSAVVKDVPDDVVAVGVPAKVIRQLAPTPS